MIYQLAVVSLVAVVAVYATSEAMVEKSLDGPVETVQQDEQVPADAAFIEDQPNLQVQQNDSSPEVGTMAPADAGANIPALDASTTTLSPVQGQATVTEFKMSGDSGNNSTDAAVGLGSFAALAVVSMTLLL